MARLCQPWRRAKRVGRLHGSKRHSQENDLCCGLNNGKWWDHTESQAPRRFPGVFPFHCTTPSLRPDFGELIIPFTPFHFGPGFFAKACAPQRFWLTSYIVANVLIDLEVLYFLHRNETPIHRYLHTYIGGIAVGLLAGIGMYVATALLIRTLPFKSKWLEELTSTSKSRLFRDSVIGGLLGGVSHIFFG